MRTFFEVRFACFIGLCLCVLLRGRSYALSQTQLYANYDVSGCDIVVNNGSLDTTRSEWTLGYALNGAWNEAVTLSGTSSCATAATIYLSPSHSSAETLAGAWAYNPYNT